MKQQPKEPLWFYLKEQVTTSSNVNPKNKKIEVTKYKTKGDIANPFYKTISSILLPIRNEKHGK